MDGDVQLWDVRGGNQPVDSWTIHTDGTSAFDVHDQTSVFARYLSLPYRSKLIINNLLVLLL